MVTAYDEVLYLGRPLAETHPDRLAALATLFGIESAPVKSCRVLELGIGDGGNLIPMAYGLPDSEFVGLDLGSRGVARAQALADELNLKNITLYCLDLREAPAELGVFDFIIVHGVYSWVSPEVQDHILRICRSHLATNGVAYVSYSTYPGARLREMIRGMMQFHSRRFSEPQEQIDQALALVRFLASAHPGSDAYGAVLHEELESLARRRPETVYHDELSDVNAPVYFCQFAEHAARHHLKYLGEADFSELQDYTYPREVADTLRRLGAKSLIDKEQYMDFLKGRRFRQTLLCHQQVGFDRRVGPERIWNLYASARVQPVSPQPDLHWAEEEFRSPEGASLRSNHPLAKAALLILGELWPQALHFDQLLAGARRRADVSSGDDAVLLGDVVLAAFATGLAELHAQVPHFVVDVSARPAASALARLQVRTSPIVTNLRHQSVRMEDQLGRQLLVLLDGTRDRASLLNNLAESVCSGSVVLEREGAAVRDPEAARRILDGQLDPSLAGMARCALLER